MRKKRFVAYRQFGLLLILIAALPSLAQTSAQQTRDGKKEDSIVVCDYTCLATIYIKVTGKNGKEVTTLRKDDFIIYEDETRQEIDSMWRNDKYKEERRQARYQISYYPVNENFDGKYRKIRVAVQTKDGKSLKAQVFPKGYHAKLLKRRSGQAPPNTRSSGRGQRRLRLTPSYTGRAADRGR
jgi:hypothetical protein